MVLQLNNLYTDQNYHSVQVARELHNRSQKMLQWFLLSAGQNMRREIHDGGLKKGRRSNVRDKHRVEYFTRTVYEESTLD